MRVIEDGRLPVLTWAEDLEAGALHQAVNCTQLPVTHHHVAVMADGHQGYGVPIGAVLPLRDAISPYAVGNDIGCGMALVRTTVTVQELQPHRDDVMSRVARAVPAGPATHPPRPREDVDARTREALTALEAAAATTRQPLSTSSSVSPAAGRPLDPVAFLDRGRAHAGTLGSGNHFVELLAGPDGEVWLMLHSGSRGIGSLVCNNFHRMALAHCAAAGVPLPDDGLAYLPVTGDDMWAEAGRAYVVALGAALAYAELNRRLILDALAGAVEARFPRSVLWDTAVNIHHNDATLEHHFGADVWVHRKGAVKATAGTATITPGSMGTGSWLGRGRGEALSLQSCSHGAGRRLSRGQARRSLALDAELARVTAAGGKVYAASTQAVLDEMPGAYKDLDDVMRAQADLVEPVRRFTPLATYKGAESPRRRGKSWRPPEER